MYSISPGNGGSVTTNWVYSSPSGASFNASVGLAAQAGLLFAASADGSVAALTSAGGSASSYPGWSYALCPGAVITSAVAVAPDGSAAYIDCNDGHLWAIFALPNGTASSSPSNTPTGTPSGSKTGTPSSTPTGTSSGSQTGTPSASPSTGSSPSASATASHSGSPPPPGRPPTQNGVTVGELVGIVAGGLAAGFALPAAAFGARKLYESRGSGKKKGPSDATRDAEAGLKEDQAEGDSDAEDAIDAPLLKSQVAAYQSIARTGPLRAPSSANIPTYSHGRQ